jgi:hypothetical protein
VFRMPQKLLPGLHGGPTRPLPKAWKLRCVAVSRAPHHARVTRGPLKEQSREAQAVRWLVPVEVPFARLPALVPIHANAREEVFARLPVALARHFDLQHLGHPNFDQSLRR